MGQDDETKPVRKRRYGHNQWVSQPPTNRDFRIPAAERRYPRPTRPGLLFKACRRCKTGDLAWDTFLEEYYCLQCGHREYEHVQTEE